MTDAEQTPQHPAPPAGAVPPPAFVSPPPVAPPAGPAVGEAPSPYVASQGTPAYGQPVAPAPYGQPVAPPSHGQPVAPPSHGQPVGPPSYGQTGAPYAQPGMLNPYGQPAAPGPYGQPIAPAPYGQPAAPGPYGQPGAYVYGQQGVPVPYGYPAYPVKPATGTSSWALGFLLFVPIPFLNVLISGIAMTFPYGNASRQNPLAHANARAAANWGLTMSTVTTSLLLLHFLLIFVGTRGEGAMGFFPLGIAISLYALVVVLHLVIVIIGTVRASGGREMRVPFAIPYLRR